MSFESNNFIQLPTEIHHLIFDKIALEDLTHVENTCTDLKKVVDSYKKTKNYQKKLIAVTIKVVDNAIHQFNEDPKTWRALSSDVQAGRSGGVRREVIRQFNDTLDIVERFDSKTDRRKSKGEVIFTITPVIESEENRNSSKQIEVIFAGIHVHGTQNILKSPAVLNAIRTNISANTVWSASPPPSRPSSPQPDGSRM